MSQEPLFTKPPAVWPRIGKFFLACAAFIVVGSLVVIFASKRSGNRVVSTHYGYFPFVKIYDTQLDIKDFSDRAVDNALGCYSSHTGSNPLVSLFNLVTVRRVSYTRYVSGDSVSTRFYFKERTFFNIPWMPTSYSCGGEYSTELH